MKIALLGATGNVGSFILIEALSRNHTVTAIVRYPKKLIAHPQLHIVKGDVFDEKHLSSVLSGHDVVISAFNPKRGEENFTAQLTQAIRNIIQAVKSANVKRLLVVGGVGSLEAQPGKRVVDMPTFPAEHKTEALANAEVLEILKQQREISWTCLSPAKLIEPGLRTGKFRLGHDQLLKDEQGNSKISTQDYAMALIDEVERPKHINQRFTLAY